MPAGGAFFRLSPEDGVGVVVEEVLDAGTGVAGLVAVELEVPVAPVQRPEAGGLVWCRRVIGNRVHSGPRSSCQGGRHSQMVRWRVAMPHSTRISPRNR